LASNSKIVSRVLSDNNRNNPTKDSTSLTSTASQRFSIENISSTRLPLASAPSYGMNFSNCQEATAKKHAIHPSASA
jgi:hypothetical protein